MGGVDGDGSVDLGLFFWVSLVNESFGFYLQVFVSVSEGRIGEASSLFDNFRGRHITSSLNTDENTENPHTILSQKKDPSKNAGRRRWNAVVHSPRRHSPIRHVRDDDLRPPNAVPARRRILQQEQESTASSDGNPYREDSSSWLSHRIL
ncbi:hypothetical protein BDW42DRAFT_60937 [Aspergillus taichungensis]|uniref:Uncharacterized protein n=1 Tax=Aspergillus taichungensis TaxID=482145 RepID=A0A2J5I1C1_9EURO|nr:hypothetical protein BDW42DRAFT_60937 [Aspergillus taichungensis]